MIALLSPPKTLSGIYILNEYILHDLRSQGFEVEMYHSVSELLSFEYDSIIVGDMVLNPEEVKILHEKTKYLGFFCSYIFQSREFLNDFDFLLGADIFPSSITSRPFFRWFPQIHADSCHSASRRHSLFTGRIMTSKINPEVIMLFESELLPLDLYGELVDNFDIYKRHYKGKYKIEDKSKVYSKYKFFILDSETDIFCLSAVEAALNGCVPIVKRRTDVLLPWLNQCPSVPVVLDREDITPWVRVLSSNYSAFFAIQKQIRKELGGYFQRISKISPELLNILKGK